MWCSFFKYNWRRNGSELGVQLGTDPIIELCGIQVCYEWGWRKKRKGVKILI